MCSASELGITEKEKLFVEEYIACHLNQTQAYINIFGCKNRDSARSKASQILAKVNVNAYKEKLLAEITFNKKAIINQSIQNLINIANGLVDEETKIQVGKQQKKITNKAELRDRINATELLLKLYGAFNDGDSEDIQQEQANLQEISDEAQPIEIEGYDK